MRRMGNIGRVVSKVRERRNVEALAAGALLRKAGLLRVLGDIWEYRVACSTGAVKVARKEAFDADKCEWLFADD